MRLVCLAYTCLLLLSSHTRAAEVLTCDFSAELSSPWLRLTGDARIEDEVLRSRAQDGWRRSGLLVGPLPMSRVTWTIQYDVRPVAFGRQCQEFVSESPGTHRYMVYVRPDGRPAIHTHSDGKWEQRAASEVALSVGRWYRVTVELSAHSIRYRIRSREDAADLWDSGPQPVDDLGAETVFGLVDEAEEATGESEWDNLRVSTDSSDVIERMERLARQMEARRREAESRQAVGRRLRGAGIAVIPTPQECWLGPGSFAMGPETVIIPDPNSPTNRTDAAAVQMVLQERLGVAYGIGTDGPAGAIILSNWPEGEATPWRGEQGYRIEVGDNWVEIKAQSPCGFFYGAQTLAQLATPELQVRRCHINDWPDIGNRLAMIAVSQGAFQVIDVEYWKRIIRELAAVKLNLIMPYFEGGTFYYEKYPFLGLKGRDGFTIDKGKALSQYAGEHFVQIVPQQEALGHSGNVLTHEELKDLRESGGVFCSSNPRTFEFLGDLFDELVRAFPDARWIHVGGDEFAHGFAQCPQCAQRAEEIGRPGLYAEHITKLRQMLKDRGRDTMIWWHEEGYTEQAADRLAKDIVVFDWHYGNQAAYPSLARLQSAGFSQTWATPAVTRYYGGTNDWDNTFGNIGGFLAEAARRRIPGECTCTWVHGIWGGRNLFELNLYGLVYSAQCAWNSLCSRSDEFRRCFGRHWFGLQDDTVEQDVMEAIHAPYGEAAEQGFWRDNRAMDRIAAQSLAATAEEIGKSPDLPEQARKLLEYCRRADAILDRWATTAPRNRVSAEFYAFDVFIHATTARRLLAVDALARDWGRLRGLSAEQRAEALEPHLAAFEALSADYDRVVRLFGRSVLEAGGGRCGAGGWYPFVAGGGVQFAAPQAIEEIGKQIEYLKQAGAAEAAPEKAFAG